MNKETNNMNIAIYQYHRQDTHSQDMNQSSEHLILSAVSLCKEKTLEVVNRERTGCPNMATLFTFASSPASRKRRYFENTPILSSSFYLPCVTFFVQQFSKAETPALPGRGFCRIIDYIFLIQRYSPSMIMLVV